MLKAVFVQELKCGKPALRWQTLCLIAYHGSTSEFTFFTSPCVCVWACASVTVRHQENKRRDGLLRSRHEERRAAEREKTRKQERRNVRSASKNTRKVKWRRCHKLRWNVARNTRTKISTFAIKRNQIKSIYMKWRNSRRMKCGNRVWRQKVQWSGKKMVKKKKKKNREQEKKQTARSWTVSWICASEAEWKLEGGINDPHHPQTSKWKYPFLSFFLHKCGPKSNPSNLNKWPRIWKHEERVFFFFFCCLAAQCRQWNVGLFHSSSCDSQTHKSG